MSVGLLGAIAVAALAWSAPREDVALPGPGATPEQAVVAYIDSLNARDFHGGDGSMGEGPELWGYELERGGDGRWHITDAGVA